jgi:hypothetical protein
MRKIGPAAAGVALAVALLALLALVAAGAQAARRPRPHLVVHPTRLKPGEQFEVRGSGFVEEAGEEVVILECDSHGERFFPLECAETFVEVTVGAGGEFSATMTAEACPFDEETGRSYRSCFVGVSDHEGEDGFGLKPWARVSVK